MFVEVQMEQTVVCRVRLFHLRYLVGVENVYQQRILASILSLDFLAVNINQSNPKKSV